MKMRYFQRYQDGEHAQVWAELYTLGATIREEPLWSDARAVAQETMRRARHNISLIVERLQQLHYQFATPLWDETASWETPGWQPTDTSIRAIVAGLESRVGRLPLSLQSWFSEVGLVNLMGFHPKLSTFCELGKSEHIDYADPLVVTYVFEPWDWYDDEQGSHPAPPYTLDFAPCYFHKSGYSGSGSVKLHIPNAAIDFALIDDAGYWDGVPFNVFLRTSFRWGSFPGFQRFPEAQRQASDELLFLTKDLLAL
jgi:hypothetical protein